MGTPVSQIYTYFLSRISTDEWLEQDQIDIYQQEWRDILEMARFYFRYPRKNINTQLVEFEVEIPEEPEEPIEPPDELPEEPGEPPEEGEEITPDEFWAKKTKIEVVEEFMDTLTNDEIQVLAILMKQEWLKRCVASLDHIRQGYDERDWSRGSQANHLDKLIKYSDFTQQESKRALFDYSRSVEFKPYGFDVLAGKNQ